MNIATLKVKFSVAGLHNWPGAPEGRGYLRPLHRHRFVFQLEALVDGLNREIEFHDLQRDGKYKLAELFPADESLLFQFGDFSCEMIAQEMILAMPHLSAVEVWEDEECGARVDAGDTYLWIMREMVKAEDILDSCVLEPPSPPAIVDVKTPCTKSKGCLMFNGHPGDCFQFLCSNVRCSLPTHHREECDDK